MSWWPQPVEQHRECQVRNRVTKCLLTKNIQKGSCALSENDCANNHRWAGPCSRALQVLRYTKQQLHRNIFEDVEVERHGSLDGHGTHCATAQGRLTTYYHLIIITYGISAWIFHPSQRPNLLIHNQSIYPTQSQSIHPIHRQSIISGWSNSFFASLWWRGLLLCKQHRNRWKWKWRRRETPRNQVQ